MNTARTCLAFLGLLVFAYGQDAAPRIHVVRKGETLSSIGRLEGLTLHQILALNPGMANRSLPENAKVVLGVAVPAPKTATVETEDAAAEDSPVTKDPDLPQDYAEVTVVPQADTSQPQMNPVYAEPSVVQGKPGVIPVVSAQMVPDERPLVDPDLEPVEEQTVLEVGASALKQAHELPDDLVLIGKEPKKAAAKLKPAAQANAPVLTFSNPKSGQPIAASSPYFRVLSDQRIKQRGLLHEIFACLPEMTVGGESKPRAFLSETQKAIVGSIERKRVFTWGQLRQVEWRQAPDGGQLVLWLAANSEAPIAEATMVVVPGEYLANPTDVRMLQAAARIGAVVDLDAHFLFRPGDAAGWGLVANQVVIKRGEQGDLVVTGAASGKTAAN